MHVARGTERKPRYLYLEALRLFSIFWVIFNHTPGFGLYVGRSASQPQFWIYMFISAFCKVAVPMFLAISGALMLGREDEPLRVLWKKRILKFAAVLVAFSFLYFLWKNRNLAPSEQNILIAFVKQFYTEGVAAHLWYLYLYIAYLIALPFLRALCRNLNEKYYPYLFGLSLLFTGIIPIAEFFVSRGSMTINEYIVPSWLLGRIPLFAMAGYYLHEKVEIERISGKFLAGLCGMDFVLIAVSCVATYFWNDIAFRGGRWKTMKERRGFFSIASCC